MAKIFWVGGAAAVPQIETISVGGTWVAGETASVTVAGQTITVTLGATVTVAHLCAALAAAINGAEAVGDESRNLIGSQAGAFAWLNAVATATTVVVTGKSDGRPFGLTVAEGSSSGTISRTTTRTATGPHHRNNAANYFGGALPADGDELIFSELAASSMLYELSDTSVTPAVVRVTEGFRGSQLRVGLPEVNVDSASYPYKEVLPTSLTLGASADAQTINVDIDCSSLTMFKFNGGTAPMNFSGRNTRPSGINGEAACSIVTNSATSNLAFSSGSYMVGQGGAACNFAKATINQGSMTRQMQVEFGEGVTASTGPIVVDGGSVIVRTSTSGGSGGIFCNGGSVNVTGGTHVLHVRGGQVHYTSSGNIASFEVYSGGHLEVLTSSAVTVSGTARLHSGGSFSAPNGNITFSNNLSVLGRIGEVKLDLGSSPTLAVS